jgi:hypothetical protein
MKLNITAFINFNNLYFLIKNKTNSLNKKATVLKEQSPSFHNVSIYLYSEATFDNLYLTVN